MKVIAAVIADFERGPLGLPARLGDDLRGESVLRHTLKRLSAVERIDQLHVVSAVEQEIQVREAVGNLDVRIETHNGGPVPWRDYVAAARKWSLDAWRGGVAGVNGFDEFLHPWVLDALARREQADAVVAAPAAAPLLDPQLMDQLIDYFFDQQHNLRWAFTQTPPGLSGAVYSPALLQDLTKIGQPMGRMLAYQPTQPQRDMTMQPCFYQTDGAVMRTVGRCLADTADGSARIKTIVNELGIDDDNQPDAQTICHWLREHRFTDVGALPREMEIELTTADPLESSPLRPSGHYAGQRKPMDFALFDRLMEEFAGNETATITLGGFGDPLMHPDFVRCLNRCREAGIFGLAVKTPAIHLNSEVIASLLANKVDVLHVILDAVTPEDYEALHGADHFDRVQENINKLVQAQRQSGGQTPLIVCEMMKIPQTMDKLEAFYDTWMGKTGGALLTGPSHHAGQWNDLSVMRMAPPARRTCGRIFQRVMILSDGTIPLCDQDFQGRHILGSLTKNALNSIWRSAEFENVRTAHQQGRYNRATLCPTCEEWHRP